ncbi:DNA repair protein RecO [Lentilactobacillus laojiaonis]|uniref:DNA repair protein RecO n=1 Tax=Lentilactobacillus laojiaonis TaxID=2883998 RepID=UPI001D0AE067|nr:DNA repair protein RecO [Lentilactobacillus laojiaonis]UDM31620.1 DNA repair protein RecO [Lentilactobacillus laojiaonis]
MNSNKIQDFNGIILYTKNYRENDLLIKFLTDQFGKKMFLVRGAKKPRFKMRAAILPFTYGTYIGDLRVDKLSYIKTVKDIKHFNNISNDIILNAYSTYIMSLIDLAYPDDEPINDWYLNLIDGMNLINNGFDSQIITNIFEIQLLDAFGVAPNWLDCSICHRSDLNFDYSDAYGGLICSNHFSMDPHRYHLDQKTIYFLRLFSAINFKNIKNIKASQETKQKLRTTIDQIYENSVGVKPKSKNFIDQINDLSL